MAARAEGARRVDSPRNNQIRGVRCAADYEIGRVPITRTVAAETLWELS
jgi:hypothetical protein